MFRDNRVMGLVSVFVLLAALSPALCTTATAAEAAADSAATEELTVADMAFGIEVDRETRGLEGEAETFDADVGRVYCWTRVTGATGSTQITHSWYHAGEPRAKVVLPVGSNNWRTYSSKAIMPAWAGRWEVKILDEHGTIIGTGAFTVQ